MIRTMLRFILLRTWVTLMYIGLMIMQVKCSEMYSNSINNEKSALKLNLKKCLFPCKVNSEQTNKSYLLCTELQRLKINTTMYDA